MLWRALRHVDRGTYIDVGAAHPVIDSVSAAFFERGWSGVHIEPEPTYAALLRSARPADHVIEAATRTIDAVLTELEFEDRPIHFMKVHVEGHELSALQGANIRKWKPWVLVIEATAQNNTRQTYQDWEPIVVDAGYAFCLFDGLNRFYVSEAHAELSQNLSYPACTLDEPFIRWRDQQNLTRLATRASQLSEQVATFKARLVTSRADNTRLVSDVALVRSRLTDMTQQAENLNAELTAMAQTLSWRVTRPLRFVRGDRAKELSLPSPSQVQNDASETHEYSQPGDAPVDRSTAREAFEKRLGQVAQLLDDSTIDLTDRLAAFEHALSKTTEAPTRVAWLGYVAATGRYPDEVALATCTRGIDPGHPRAFVTQLEDLFEHSLELEFVSLAKLDIVRDGVLFDVTDTAANDLHTGIQRVVREVGERWLGIPTVVGVWWDHPRGCLRRIGAHELARFREWRSHLPQKAGSEASTRLLIDCPEDIVVPWESTIVLPELVCEAAHTAGYRALASAGTLTGISMLCYDLIPITAAETVELGMESAFCVYLSLVKHATKISTISETTAIDFRAFGSTLASQGLATPIVQAHLLPASPLPSTPADIENVRETYQVGTSPLVLVVGNHEPRKNHLLIVAAAERLWNDGIDFTLAFIGGGGWKRAQFDLEIDRLQSLQLPVITRMRTSEAELWAAYRLARFTVFPSWAEGFGLPIVESMACGTPVITSNYGAMAEVARGGGAVLIDPRNVDDLTSAMRQLLEDDALVAKLSGEAAQRKWPDWSDYADRVWQFLAPGTGQ